MKEGLLKTIFTL